MDKFREFLQYAVKNARRKFCFRLTAATLRRSILMPQIKG